MLKKFTLDAKKWCRHVLRNSSNGKMCALGQYEDQGGYLSNENRVNIWAINDDSRPLRSKVKELKQAFAKLGIKMSVKGLK